jgi:hypothetical protein
VTVRWGFIRNAADLVAFFWAFCGLFRLKTGKLTPGTEIFTVSFQHPDAGFTGSQQIMTMLSKNFG